MTTSKIAITVPQDVLARARTAVKRGRATSLSAYVSEAIDQKVMLDELDAMLEAMLAETGGPITRAERARARRDLASAATPSPRPRKRRAP